MPRPSSVPGSGSPPARLLRRAGEQLTRLDWLRFVSPCSWCMLVPRSHAICRGQLPATICVCSNVASKAHPSHPRRRRCRPSRLRRCHPNCLRLRCSSLPTAAAAASSTIHVVVVHRRRAAARVDVVVIEVAVFPACINACMKSLGLQLSVVQSNSPTTCSCIHASRPSTCGNDGIVADVAVIGVYVA